MYIRKKKKDYYNNLLDRLVQHPYQNNLPSDVMKRFGKHREIRVLKNEGMLDIKHGSIGIPQGFKIKKTKHGWEFVTK